jgi:ABC-2 type transport system ATP-binding protein
VRADPQADAARLLAALPSVEAVAGANGLLDVVVDTAQAAAINRMLVQAGVAVSEIYAQTASLEDVFLELTTTDGGAGS